MAKKNLKAGGLYLTAILLLFPASIYADKNVKVFRMIEFKELKYISKYEIIDLADMSIKDNNIIIDMNSLEKALNDMPLVSSYKITEANQRLVISIVENKPVFSLAVTDGEKNLFFELDGEFRQVSANRIHALDLPLIVVTGADFAENKISPRLRAFLGLINDLNKNNLQVIKEISEIDYTGIYGAKAFLKGRRTVFQLEQADRESFSKLNYAVGYFDRIKYYPHTFTILNGEGILE